MCDIFVIPKPSPREGIVWTHREGREPRMPPCRMSERRENVWRGLELGLVP